MTKVVLDTNILVSAMVVTKGKPAQIVGFAFEGKFVLVLCDPILHEADIVLHRKHIQKRFHPSDSAIETFLTTVRALGTRVQPQDIAQVISQDPSDDLILACAVEGGAEYLVSGDLHFLNLQQYRHVKMVTPAQFLEILAAL